MPLRTISNKIDCNNTGDLLYYALSFVASSIFALHVLFNTNQSLTKAEYSSWEAWSLHSGYFFCLNGMIKVKGNLLNQSIPAGTVAFD